MKHDKRKQSLYLPEDQLQWVEGQATRLDRTYSWIVQAALKLSREKIEQFPAVNP